MNDTPSPDMKVLLFYAVVVDPDEFSPSKLKVTTRNPEIKSYLEKTRLLNCRQKGKSPVLHLSANDATWRWVEEHFEDELPRKIEPAFQLLNALRGKLARYMAVSELRLSDVFAPEVHPTKHVASAQTSADQVRRAYLELSQAQFDVRVRLRDLRPKLANLNRTQQDEALLGMQRDGWLVLYPNDDPQDRNADDDAASIILGDRHRDLVYLHREQRQ